MLNTAQSFIKLKKLIFDYAIFIPVDCLIRLSPMFGEFDI